MTAPSTPNSPQGTRSSWRTNLGLSSLRALQYGVFFNGGIGIAQAVQGYYDNIAINAVLFITGAIQCYMGARMIEEGVVAMLPPPSSASFKAEGILTEEQFKQMLNVIEQTSSATTKFIGDGENDGSRLLNEIAAVYDKNKTEDLDIKFNSDT